MGTPRKSLAMRMLTNNASKRALPEPEPEVAQLDHAAPGELRYAEERAEWARVIVGAIDAGIITAADRALAVAHCQLWARYAAQIQRPGVSDGDGALKTMALLLRIDVQLGLTPTARRNVATVAPKTRKDNPLAKYLKNA